ncbi:MAG TPA: hypothetical protein VF088_08095 [Pyrinomonadaceae bacterium]
MEYDNIQHAQLRQSYKAGANWFYWIAGLTFVTSLIAFGGGGWRFLISLGSTQLIDGFGQVLANDLGTAAKVVGLVLDLIVIGLFVLFGWLANQKHLWAYIVGMVAFTLDGLISLLFGDLIGVVAHAVVLYFLFRGFQAGRSLVSLEKAMAERAAAPQPEPAV